MYNLEETAENKKIRIITLYSRCENLRDIIGQTENISRFEES
jgi:hypothetical protein